jgi:cytochrome c peroxidase
MTGERGFRRRVRGAPRRFLLQAVAVAGLSAGVYALASSSTAGAPAGSSWRWDLPANFPKPRVPKTNPMSAAKVEVGRRLFYDTRLSGNGTQACASCHRQELAFTDGRAQAIGSTGQLHPRNAQPLANVAYDATLTWANPALVTLEHQMEVPLFGERPVEMGVTDANKAQVLARIRRDRWYSGHFARAFPGRRQPISWTTIIRSIAAFQRSIISADSRYDRYLRGKAKLTASERRGMNLFMGERAECHHCHGSFIFNDQATYVGAPTETPLFHNTGLYNVAGTGAFPAPNRGVFELTGRPQDMGRFKAPSLRNVALTAPYMHDGSVATLEQVVDNYAAGGRVITEGPLAGDGRANPHKDPLISGIDLSVQDRADLVAFLKTLTDRTLVTDRRFSDPFARSAGGER